MTKKNILVIMCDQLRKDCLGCYGNEVINTPNIDLLASKSVKFTKNYVANPICMPNRLTMFSGMYPKNHGVWTNGIVIQDEGNTLMHHLKSHDYQTASIGKIHFQPGGCEHSDGSFESDNWYKNDGKGQDFHGPHFGFDYIELMNAHGGIAGHMIPWFFENGGTEEMLLSKNHTQDIQTGTMNTPKHLTSSAFVGDRACNYLTELRDKEKPFFLVASFPDPHHPFKSPQESYEKVKDYIPKDSIGSASDLQSRPKRYMDMHDGAWSRKGLSEPKHLSGIPEDVAKERKLHTYAMIELIDEYVGKIISTLEDEKLLDDTIILFTSDHGELLGDFDLWTKGPFFFDGLVNTPLLVCVPDNSSRECNELISAVDFSPTVCGLLGLDIPYYMDGINQAKTVIGEDKNLRNMCMIEYRNGFQNLDLNYKVLITKQLKYTLCQNGDEELTDLVSDFEELKNEALNPVYEEKLLQMRNELLKEMIRTESKKPWQSSFA